jgi:protein tyrosine phosphatase
MTTEDSAAGYGHTRGSRASPTQRSYILIKDRVVAGAFPDKKFEIKNLLDYGITHFLDLTEPIEMMQQSCNSYIEHLPLNIIYESFPIEDGSVVPDNELASLVRRIAYTLQFKKNSKYYIHCRGGFGRTGTVAACLLQQLFGITPQESLGLLTVRHKTRQIGAQFNSPQTPEQILQVLRYQRLGHY